MQKIVPHLWFDTQAVDAAKFYAATFPNSTVDSVSQMHGTPSGDVDVVAFTVLGHKFEAISAGPYFTLNPSVSFMVNFDPSQMPDAAQRIDAIWNALAKGGTVRMPIGEYPFSKRFGWVDDKFGVSWQLILTNPAGEPRPIIMPALLFTQAQNGKAEEATDFYLSVFKNAKRGMLMRVPEDNPMMKKGQLMFTDLTLENQWFVAMDGGTPHQFGFNEAASFIVKCADQQEIDYYWNALSAHPESEQCGWVKDKYGVSWQILPANMGELMAANPEKTTPAMLAMKKIDIVAIQAAGQQE